MKTSVILALCLFIVPAFCMAQSGNSHKLVITAICEKSLLFADLDLAAIPDRVKTFVSENAKPNSYSETWEENEIFDLSGLAGFLRSTVVSFIYEFMSINNTETIAKFANMDINEYHKALKRSLLNARYVSRNSKNYLAYVIQPDFIHTNPLEKVGYIVFEVEIE